MTFLFFYSILVVKEFISPHQLFFFVKTFIQWKSFRQKEKPPAASIMFLEPRGILPACLDRLLFTKKEKNDYFFFFLILSLNGAVTDHTSRHPSTTKSIPQFGMFQRIYIFTLTKRDRYTTNVLSRPREGHLIYGLQTLVLNEDLYPSRWRTHRCLSLIDP